LILFSEFLDLGLKGLLRALPSWKLRLITIFSNPTRDVCMVDIQSTGDLSAAVAIVED
jgi:hypothetical protein